MPFKSLVDNCFCGKILGERQVLGIVGKIICIQLCSSSRDAGHEVVVSLAFIGKLAFIRAVLHVKFLLRRVAVP